jgi:F-type H+-transporting ATPase subunit delta
MQNPRLASRYAKSLLDLAVEQNSVEATLADMQLLDHICRISPEFAMMLRSPVINGDKKQAVIKAVWEDKVNVLTQAFVSLLINKGREASLPEIAPAFVGLYKQMKNIKTVKLTTAAPVNDVMKQDIMSKIAKDLEGYTVELTSTVDPELIGGFILEMEDKLFDASVRRHLNDVKAQFQDNSYISHLN